MRLLWSTYLPDTNRPAAPKAPMVASPIQTLLFVGIIAYLLFYPLFSEVGVLQWLVLPRKRQRHPARLYHPTGARRPWRLPFLLLLAWFSGQETPAVVGLSGGLARI
jgi:hypothetical protein